MDINEALSKFKKFHFIGIGGAGMCPLAEILHKRGYILTGSDNNESDTLDRIRRLGIPVKMGHSKENLGDAEAVVFTAALLDTNPELLAAKELGLPCFERSKLFGAVSSYFESCVGVCGTHGKTTVTSMTVHSLISAGADPSAVIGGRLPLTGTNGIVGSSELFICEACEFANTFLDLSPTCSVILNIDEDHLDYFKTMDNLRESFRRFADMAKTVIYNGDDENTLMVVNSLQDKELISFGESEGCTLRAVNINEYKGAYFEFDALKNGELLTHIRLNITGRHNVENALAALAACLYCGICADEARLGIESFSGAGRRFELLYQKHGITVIDDYAHHPAELEVTISSAMAMNFNCVWAVFQPFTFSRTKMHFDSFVKVLSRPDKTVLTEIMGSREINTYDVYSSQLQEKIEGSVLFDSFDKIADYLFENVKPGDLVLTMGCGDVYKIAKKLIKKYNEKYDEA